MRRILHVINSLSCGSGMMSLIMNYYRAIDKKKYQFDFLYFDEVGLDYKNEIESLGGIFYKIRRPSLSVSFYRDISEFLKENSNKYYAIHCHPIIAAAYIGIFKQKYNIKYIIQHSHTSKLSSHIFGILRNKMLLCYSKRYITNYIGCSKESLQLISKKELNKKNNVIINNCIDYNRFKFNVKDRVNIRKKFDIREDTILVGHVGRFSNEKNHELLIKIFEEYHKIHKNSKLLLVGEGPLKKNIYEFVDKMKISCDVIFVGNVIDVEKYYSAMDFLVFPSVFEGFGLTTVEAQVNGLFVFASKNVPGCTKISNRIFFVDRDVNDYISSIDDNYRYNLNRNNIKISFDYDIKKNVSDLIKFYNNLGK